MSSHHQSAGSESESQPHVKSDAKSILVDISNSSYALLLISSSIPLSSFPFLSFRHPRLLRTIVVRICAPEAKLLAKLCEPASEHGSNSCAAVRSDGYFAARFVLYLPSVRPHTYHINELHFLTQTSKYTLHVYLSPRRWLSLYKTQCLHGYKWREFQLFVMVSFRCGVSPGWIKKGKHRHVITKMKDRSTTSAASAASLPSQISFDGELHIYLVPHFHRIYYSLRLYGTLAGIRAHLESARASISDDEVVCEKWKHFCSHGCSSCFMKALRLLCISCKKDLSRFNCRVIAARNNNQIIYSWCASRKDLIAFFFFEPKYSRARLGATPDTYNPIVRERKCGDHVRVRGNPYAIIY